MKRSIDLDMVPADGYTDEHATCAFTDCGALMSFDAETGVLSCPDCRVDALTVEEIVHAERIDVAS